MALEEANVVRKILTLGASRLIMPPQAEEDAADISINNIPK